jgi:hypothetical protein
MGSAASSVVLRTICISFESLFACQGDAGSQWGSFPLFRSDTGTHTGQAVSLHLQEWQVSPAVSEFG